MGTIAQLEYWVSSDWFEVVRHGHDSEWEVGHDVTEEGLYMDICRSQLPWRSRRGLSVNSRSSRNFGGRKLVAHVQRSRL
jgi:hypothetical protein